MRMLSPDRKRNCSTEKNFNPLANKSQQICLPIEQEEYDQILFDPQAFRQYMDGMLGQRTTFCPNRRKCLGYACGALNSW
jgi:hypothetical protein